MADRYWGLRSRYAYAWREMLDRGARLVFGSDAPVESPNPFFGVHAAVTRRGLDGEPGPQGWIPEQRIALAEALRAYTSAPSALAGTTSTLGVLHPGFHADLIVLDEDPYQLPGDRLATIAPWATMVAGKWVYRSEAASA
jgi:predicted amidohydrolase YtcJ